MAVEDDSAWAEWDAAFEELKRAHVVLEQLTHLPKNDPGRREATKDWNRTSCIREGVRQDCGLSYGHTAARTRPPNGSGKYASAGCGQSRRLLPER